jgi:hypothetical protein
MKASERTTKICYGKKVWHYSVGDSDGFAPGLDPDASPGTKMVAVAARAIAVWRRES